MWMPSICTTSRSSLDRSEVIHSFMRAAESATKWREAADFDTHCLPAPGTSPSGNRTARRNFRAGLDPGALFVGKIMRKWPRSHRVKFVKSDNSVHA